MSDGLERQAAHFDRIAETYLRSRQHRNHLTLKDLMWREFLDDKQCLKKEGLRILEPMCGFADGRTILSAHLGTTFDYRGFDYSGAVVDRLRELEPDIAVSYQDVTQFEADAAYDVIILLGGLHHVPSHAVQVVRNLAGALKPGGYFINLEPTDGNRGLAWVRRWIYRRNKLFDEETERSFPISEYYGMFERTGLRLVDGFYPGLLAYVLYYNPDAFPLLNIGGPGMVRAIWGLERPFRRSAIGRMFSFATLSLWRKPGTA
jgi:SAM-dependent methyltransferase